MVPSAASDTAAPGGTDGPVADPALDLFVGAAGAGADGEPEFAQQFVLPDGGLVGSAVEVAHGDDALAARTADHGLGAEDIADGGEVLGRVGLAERAADGAAVAHHRVGNHLLGVPARWGTARRPRPIPASVVWRVRAPTLSVFAVAQDEVEFVEVVDVDQPFRPGQPELHHRQQAVAAGDDPRLGTVACEKFQRVVHAWWRARSRMEPESA